MNVVKELAGELLGTFILVLVGCGSVAVAVLYFPLELWHVALVWSLGVALAIYVTRGFSSSHLNPAVTFAMALAKKCEWKKVPAYFLAQLGGAVLAAILLLCIINSDLATYEIAEGIVRGDAHSYHSAVMFGEFFPNPGYENILQVSQFKACIAEGMGTFVLVFSIFILTAKQRGIDSIIPLLIGLTVGAIILVVAPYTQAGLNPARDFGPRLVAYFGGWGNAAFPSITWSFLTVYIVSPLLGSVLAYQVYNLIYKRDTHIT
jgi:glycerol uptake facilitator protein